MNTTEGTMTTPQILRSYTHAASGLRFDEFQTRFGSVEFFLLDRDGKTLFQGSLGNCIDRAAREMGLDAEWLHGQAAGPDWRALEALNQEVVYFTREQR